MISRIMSLLKANGHEVEAFFRDSSELQASTLRKVRAFFSGFFSVSARRHVRRVLREFNPDIVQVQNLYPLISPAVLPVIRRAGIPVVMRLSNYRLVCPSGLFLSHGELCERCRGGREYWCAIRNCEKNRIKSVGYALRNAFARTRGYYSSNVSRYYAQTEFQKELLVSEGLPSARVGVVSNMVEPATESGEERPGVYVGFVGRMSPEKGIETFLEMARKCPEIPFKVAGDAGKYQSGLPLPTNVETLGHLGKDALEEFYLRCRFVVVPSLWYEGFPGVIIESMRQAKPVVASRIGGLPEIVRENESGLLFEPGDVDELAEKVRELWNDDSAVKRLGDAGLERVARDFLPQHYYEKLISVYNQALEENVAGNESRRLG